MCLLVVGCATCDWKFHPRIFWKKPVALNCACQERLCYDAGNLWSPLDCSMAESGRTYAG